MFPEQMPKGGNIPVRRHKQVIKTALPEGGQRGSSHSVPGCTNPSTWVTNLQIEQIRITVRDGFMIRIGDGAQFRIGDEAQSSVQGLG